MHDTNIADTTRCDKVYIDIAHMMSRNSR